MQMAQNHLAKQRQQQAMALSREAKGARLNLGKKISVPRDTMMEELNLQSNRGSRMFQERQRRSQMFTLEGVADSPNVLHQYMDQSQYQNYSQNQPVPQTKQVHSAPMKEIPGEKLNVTGFSKTYCSPWMQALGSKEEFQSSPNVKLLQLSQKLQPANFRCFNRTARPFGGSVTSKRVIPVISYEPVEQQTLPSMPEDILAFRPNFNRAPRGWGPCYSPESNDL